MAKVFRLYNIQGNNNIVDWQDTNVYGTKAISEITDPDGATAKKEITSIPSPFARIDLVKTAFKEVVNMVRKKKNVEEKKNALDGITVYHKMVSEMFDVGELFFNYDRFKDNFEILVWDRNNDLEDNTVFGGTLNLYLKADAVGADPYNFGRMNRIYMLNYVGPDRPSDMNIVGGTSPATLFFSSSNDMSFVSKHVLFDNDRPFDDDYQPLYKRSFEFQKYLFALRKSNNNFAQDFPEVSDYLESTYACLSNEQKNELDALTETSVTEYEPIGVGDRGQDFLEILGRPFHKKMKVSNWRSDFAIRSSLWNGNRNPLVLPVEKGNIYTDLIYTTKNWETEFHAPYVVQDKDGKTISLNNRKLPMVNEDYPYLTISDFLSDTIVKMPYAMNGEKFYDGGLICKNEDDEYSFLLPLKKDFFQFFTVKDLQETVAGTNKHMFEFVENASGVKVILRIPIQKNRYIEYSRIYYDGMAPNLKKNDGGMIETKIGMGIMPLVRFPNNVQKHYRVAMFDKGKNEATLSFFDGTNSIGNRKVVRAEKDLAGRGCSHEAYAVDDNFDRVLVKVGDIEGFVVPKFKPADNKAASVFTFAVDFGTTNTHIEYSSNTNPTPKPFDIKFDIEKDERQMHKLHKRYTDPDIRLAFEQDFIPDSIGDKYCFPMRTVFAHHSGMKIENNPMPLCDGNIPFLYEKEFMPSWNTVCTELKWGGVPDRLLVMYLESLFILMRNKVVLNGGNLSATKVIWFYPASMTIGKINLFSQIWNNAYRKYFDPNTFLQNVISISESKAPYLHFIKKKSATPETVTIDIGGGTTDVFVVERSQDQMLLSFRFASNAIFGDSYNSNPRENGFVCKYLESLRVILRSNDLLELLQAMNQIEEQGRSSDIINFLFSLVGEKVKNNSELDLLDKLSKDGRMKYVFIIFYGSILYFIARVMKAKGLMKPKTIAFSGNGARTKCILSNEDTMVAEFAKLIFDSVYGDTEGTIVVKMEDDNPKVATCMGGIEDPTPQAYNTIGNLKTVYAGNDFNSGEGCKLTYADITTEMETEVVKSVEDFFHFLFELHQNNNQFLINSLAADPSIFNEVKEFCLGEEGRQLLHVSMSQGITNKRQSDSVNDDTPLEETLFFYPLVGLLHDLAFKISKMN